ncbi:MAG TPA: tyrosinase family oxidase copper chaperone [Actinoplanes sp.]|nr:tyrosinase family oxidase copper chaperone [Actinoplanes sp.]
MADVKRRDVLRYGAAGATTAATALVAGQALASPDTANTGSDPKANRKPAGPEPEEFEETYRGKRIRGRYNSGGLTSLDLGLGALTSLGGDITRTLGLAGQSEVYVNNRALALTAIPTMFFPTDGRRPYVGIGLISAINHYDPVELELNPNCLRKLGKKVVDMLGDLELSGDAAQEHTH